MKMFVPRVIFLCTMLVTWATSGAQTTDEFVKLYNAKQYAAALDMCSKMINIDSTASFANYMTGRIHAEMEHDDTAVPYLQTAIRLDKDDTYISGWSYAYLGLAYIKLDKVREGRTNAQKCIDLEKTKNSVQFAKRLLAESIAADIQADWTSIETENIIYRFQDTAGWGTRVQRYIGRHDSAYHKINRTFHAKLPKKLTLYVWNDRKAANKVLEHDPGYSEPRKCICQLHRDQTIGHEMTHVLSYWSWGMPPTEMTRFINEGTSVCYDQRKEDKVDVAKIALEGTKYHSILDIWNICGLVEETVLYPAAGAFVNYLYSRSTLDQFKSIVKDQTINNAVKTYGKETFDKMVKEFDAMVALK